MAKVTPIMGKGSGIKELEHCPDSYHFELTADELTEAIQDPDAAARRLGVDAGIRSIHITLPLGDLSVAAGRRKYCCIKCLTDSWC